MTSGPATTPARGLGGAHASLISAMASFLLANAIHNSFGLDPAVVPMLVVGGLYAWRRTPALLWTTAFVIALPAASFFDPSYLSDPGTRAFWNHLALFAAGLSSFMTVMLYAPGPPEADVASGTAGGSAR